MAIPDAILLKPGALSQSEWEIMRKHPVYAYELLSPVQYLRPSLDIPYSHHERWNGSGYPLGLQGEQIPLPARIFAVIDVYDAMTSTRPYHPPRSLEETLAYINSQAGRHFDPQVVKAFLMVFGF
jgi:HD-GYP domain-containing protein (c-di-GMP phosphodiesterase class II)